MDPSNNTDPQPASPRHRRNTAIGVGAGLLGGGAIGLMMVMPTLTSAATDEGSTTVTTGVVQDDTGTDTSTDTTGETDTEVVATAEPGARIRELLQELVDAGTITAEQADAVAEHIAANRPERGGPGRGHHPGFDGEMLAGLLGIDVETLRTELREGNTVAEIATEHGVDVPTVIDALVAEAAEHIQLSVDNGRLTQEEADAKLAEVTERITDRVNDGGSWRG